MVEIHWKDGTSSLVKVDSTVHQAMIVGMYNDVTQTQQAQTAQKDTKTRDPVQRLVIFFSLRVRRSTCLQSSLNNESLY